MKKALVIGIDDYPTSPLYGCVNDAVAVANMLEKNGDGSPNFDIKLLTSNAVTIAPAPKTLLRYNLCKIAGS